MSSIKNSVLKDSTISTMATLVNFFQSRKSRLARIQLKKYEIGAADDPDESMTADKSYKIPAAICISRKEQPLPGQLYNKQITSFQPLAVNISNQPELANLIHRLIAKAQKLLFSSFLWGEVPSIIAHSPWDSGMKNTTIIQRVYCRGWRWRALHCLFCYHYWCQVVVWMEFTIMLW